MAGRTRRNIILGIALIAMLAGVDGQVASAQSAWTGGRTAANPKDGMWSVGGNWDPAGVPASAGTTTLDFNSGADNGNYTATNDIAGTFDLNRIRLANSSRTIEIITGNPLRFLDNGLTAPSIEGNAGFNAFRIENNIQLGASNTNLVGAEGFVVLTGVISNSPAATTRALTVNTAGATYVLSGTNTYTGGTALTAGLLRLGSNTALGTGPLTINGGDIGPNGDTRFPIPLNATITNPVVVKGSFQAGRGPLTFNGTTTGMGVNNITVATPTTQPGRTMPGIPGGPLILGGPVTGPTDVIRATGAAAGPFVNDPATENLGKRQLGGVLMFGADNPNFRGSLDVVSGTVILNGTLGSAATPASGVAVRNGARLMGLTQAPGGSERGVFLSPGGKVSVNRGGIFQPGMSPGIFQINGRDAEFGAGSVYEFEFDGPMAGDGLGFHDLLRMNGGTVSLLSDTGQEPIVDVEVLGLTSLPVVGQTYAVIDIANPSISRVTGDFMSPSGSDLFDGAKFFDDQGFQWQISYHGGDGNDVVLTSQVPEPGTLTLFVVGFVAWAAAKASGKWRSRVSTPGSERRAQISPTSSGLALDMGKWVSVVGMMSLTLSWPAIVHAVAFTWSGAGNVWSAPGNWTPEGVPKMAGDSATITTGGSNGISLDIDPTLDSFTMNSAAKSLSITGHTITVNGPSTVDAGLIQLSNGAWAGTGTLSLNQNAVLSATGSSSIMKLDTLKGRLTVTGTKADGAALTIGNLVFTNGGTVTLNSDAAGKETILTVSPVLINSSGSSVTFQGTNGALRVRGTIRNEGSLVVNANTTIQGNPDFSNHQNPGTITIAKDTILTFIGLSLQNSGTIQGKGTLDARQLTAVNPKGVINSGFLKPGSSPGIFTINGAYTQMSQGVLDIEIDGPLLTNPITNDTDYSQLVVTGSVELDGLLNVDLRFIPDPSTTFDVLAAQGGLEGMFSNASSILETPLGTFDVSYLGSPSSPSIVRLSDFRPNPVPEPSTLFLLGSGLASLLGYRWRRRKESVSVRRQHL